MLSSNTDVLINENFQLIKDKYEDLDKQIEGSCFSFKFVRYKNAPVNPRKIMMYSVCFCA